MIVKMILLITGMLTVTAIVLIFLFVTVRSELRRIWSIFRAMSLLTKTILLVCCASLYLHGSLKTNISKKTYSPINFLLFRNSKVINETQMYVNAWNTTGVWDDSFWCKFENDFVFPFGTNYLKGVEVLSYGEVWSTPEKSTILADLGEKLAIGSNISHFHCAYVDATYTNEAMYVFSWDNGLINRDVANQMDARIELRRSGDILVVTNGVERLNKRTLPFKHNGFGQDNEWVKANFTNSKEILTIGYTNWVNEQIGINLDNGYYKFIAKVNEKPSETTELIIDNYSVAITNAGEYIFLLEKGVEYEFYTYPFIENVSYSWTDDLINNSFSEIEALSGIGENGIWNEDSFLEVAPPTKDARGVIIWMPKLKGMPDVVHLKSDDFPLPFFAILTDCRLDESAIQYHWKTEDSNINIVAPMSQETLVDIDIMPNWKMFDMSVTATIANRVLCSTLTGTSYGIHEVPTVSCSITVPQILILKEKQMHGSRPDTVTISMISDIPTNGTLNVSIEEGCEKIISSINLPKEYQINDATVFTRSFTIDGISESEKANDVKLKCEFIAPSSVSKPISTTSTLTVINPLLITLPQSPPTGTCVVKDTPITAILNFSPSNVFVGNVEWFTAKRRTNDNYDEWKLSCRDDAIALISTPEAGVFALKARVVSATQSNETVYVHIANEPFCEAINEELSPNYAGYTNHFGVARSQDMLRLRNTALTYLGGAKYGFNTFLESKYGYTKIEKGQWKCNRFVADVAIEAGFDVPKNKVYQIIGPTYPPTANDWATGNGLGSWIHLGSVYPEPGFIAAKYASEGLGHCGIVDYDGWVISARRGGVGRNALKMLSSLIKYNVHEE